MKPEPYDQKMDARAEKTWRKEAAATVVPAIADAQQSLKVADAQQSQQSLKVAVDAVARAYMLARGVRADMAMREAELTGLLRDLLRIIGGSAEIERTVSDYDLARVQRAEEIVGVSLRTDGSPGRVIPCDEWRPE